MGRPWQKATYKESQKVDNFLNSLQDLFRELDIIFKLFE